MSGTSGASGASNAQQNPQAVNLAIRQAVLSTALEVKQTIYTNTLDPRNGNNVLNVPIKNVGLIKGFIVTVSASVANTGSGAATLTPFGAANVLSNLTFTDLDQYQRLSTPGWLLSLINTAKEGAPFGSALLATSMDTPIKFGNNLSIIAAPATLAATTGTGTINMSYWVPLAYSKSDLRGSMFAGVVNATAYLALTINAQPGMATGDSTLACYSGANSAVAITSATVNVTQVYLDQLPRYTSGPNQGAPVLPPLDVMTQYRIMNTSLTGITAGQDFAIPFSNFQEFLSLTMIYDQAGTLNPGSDINYFALSAANTYTSFKVSPVTQGLIQRMRIKTDLPSGAYMFDFRDQPINTNMSGNMQVLMNPITAAAGSVVLAGFESFALVNSVLGASSLPSS